MRRAERAEIVRQKLAKLYPDPPIPLDHKDPFTLLVAVVLSAQCTDKAVNKVTPALFKLADTPEKMRRRSVDQILAIIKPLGLAPTKAKSIHALSNQLVEEFGGEVPACIESLETLPGVGHKTASVVMSQAFGVPSFPVDTHIHRLAQRWGLTNGKNVTQTERDLKKVFPEASWNPLHLQIIYYGREFCGARTCDGTRCEICQTLYPKRRKPFEHRKA